MVIQSPHRELPKISEVEAALLAAVNSLPVPRAAERLFNLASRPASETSPEACGEEVLGELLVQHDPYEPGFAERLDQALPFGSPAAVGGLLQLFPQHSPVVALRQVWAVAAARPVMAAFLARGVLSTPVAAAFPHLVPEMRRLVGLALEVGPRRYHGTTELGSGPLRDSYLAKALVECLEDEFRIPSLGGWNEAKPGLRLRFQWAAMAHRSKDAKELLEAATNIIGVTVYLMERELSRAAKAWSNAGQPLRQLPALQSVYLPMRVQRWLQESQTLRELVLKGAPTPYLRWSRKQQAARFGTERLVEQAKVALQCADFRRAGQILLSMVGGPLADKVLREKLTCPPRMNVPATPPVAPSAARAYQRWSPMAPEAAALWQKRVPNVRLPAWWSCSVDEVVAGLAANQWSWSAFSSMEKARLQASWKPAHEQLLVSANVFAAVPLSSKVWRSAGASAVFGLARSSNAAFAPLLRMVLLGMEDARPLLAHVAQSTDPQSLRAEFAELMAVLQPAAKEGREQLSWFRWEAPLIGTPEWHQAPEWMREAKRFLAGMPGYLRRGGKPLHLPGFVAVFEEEIVASAWPAPAIAQVLLQWTKVQPQSARQLLGRLPVPVLTALLQHRRLPAGLAEVAAQYLNAAGLPVSEAQLDAFRLRTPETLDHVAVALWRQPLLKDKAHRWRHSWNLLPGQDSLRDDCRMLLARRQARTVVALAKELGAERFQAAALRVAHQLVPFSRGEAALLEISAPLLPEELGALWVALAWCRRVAGPGHLLDHTYRRYTLPKPSGGTRVIHAPAWPVKVAQRAVLRAYLAPLGAHASACGFVAGRSICDNAVPHVGQRVVANADVRQCFPSVSWQRVLGVLRRDLQPALSSTAIGLLLDLVTAEGALPIGAPTSPALLNRVLLRSDEILTELAASHGVQYTRYADDLTFSGDGAAVKMLGHAKRVLGQVGLELDPKKTNIFRRGRRQTVTGLTVNDRVSVPRKLRRELRAAVHAIENGRDAHWHGLPQSLASMRGRLAFLAMAHPAEAQALREKLEAAK